MQVLKSQSCTGQVTNWAGEKKTAERKHRVSNRSFRNM